MTPSAHQRTPRPLWVTVTLVSLLPSLYTLKLFRQSATGLRCARRE
jgi:hypothetical protein